MNLRVLFVEDSSDDVELMLGRLCKGGIEPLWKRVQTEASLREALADGTWQVALVDFNLPGFGGLQALALLAEAAPDVPSITVSGAISEEIAVATITAGAVDYVLKDNLTRLAPAVRRAVEGADLRREQRRAARQAEQAMHAIEHSSQAIAYIGRDGTILYENVAAGRLKGLSPDEAIGGSICDWLPLIDESDTSALWDAAQHSLLEIETTMRSVAGREFPVAVTIESAGDPNAAFVVYARDVSEQREAELRVAESEARYGRLTDNAPDIIFRYDFLPSPGLAYINPAVEAITGHSPEECYAEPQLMLAMVHADDAASMAGVMQSLNPPDEPLLMRWVGKDDVTRWMESRLVAVRDAEGRCLAVEGITRDVTERIQAEDALRQSATRFRDLSEHTPIAYQSLNADGRIIDVNRDWLQLLGFTREEVMDRSFGEFWTAETRHLFTGAFAHLKQQCAVDNAEIRLLSKNGDTVTVVLTGRVQLNAEGELDRTHCVIVDISERKRAEEALQRSEAQLRTLIETLPDLVWLKDCEGVYLSCNPRFEAFFGAPESEIVGKTDYDFQDAAVADSFREHDRVAMEARSPTANEEEIVFSDDGHKEILETIKTPVHGADGRLIGVLGVGRDITERKLAEEALRESEERFEGFAANFPGYLFMQDEDLRYVYVNRHQEEDGHVLRGAWLDRTPSQVWGGDYAARAEETVQRALDGEVVDVVELWAPPGVHEHLHTICFPVPRRGKAPLAGGLSLDVTEQVEAQEVMRRQAAQLRRALEGTVLALSLVVETRDPYTAGHERRVSELATAIAVDMGMEGEELDALR
ncbi:MAG TPA: PAS domain S-box protein, partial [Thermoleophilia bacterium]|nr:PAS domain S-box protein [Thermoleophilia bacterium]